MGNCVGPPNLPAEEQDDYRVQSMADKQIQKHLEAAAIDDREWVKLLLLGTGDSGKSTLFKQIVYLYQKDRDAFDEAARRPFKPVIFSNVIGSMQTLLRQSEVLPEDLGCMLAPSVQGSKNLLLHKTDATSEITRELAEHIGLLWNDDGCKRTYDCRAQFQLQDSCRYFFNKIRELAAPDYVPSYQDVLQCRARTVGIVETEFHLEGVPFKMVDVGGQRNERRKWIHCFENVTAVIFVAAVNEYDQVLYEAHDTNRVEEALDLFEELCNSVWFENTALILFLNKRDLFEEKLLRLNVPLEKTFPEYKGGFSVHNALAYLSELFLGCNQSDTRTVYPHITCATDTGNVQFTFDAVKDIIIKTRLKKLGLMR